MVQLQICQGTTCYVMGASTLASWASELPEDIRDRVKVVGSHCLGYCNDGEFSRPPYVKVDDEVIAEATPEKILESIRKHLSVE